MRKTNWKSKIDQTWKIGWEFADVESRVHSEIELIGWQCGFEGFLSQTVGLWCGFGGWVLLFWRLITVKLEVGYYDFGGWVRQWVHLWWCNGGQVTVPPALLLSPILHPCSAPPLPHPLLCKFWTQLHLSALNWSATPMSSLSFDCNACHTVVWYCSCVKLLQWYCIVRQLTGMALH